MSKILMINSGVRIYVNSEHHRDYSIQLGI
jgi:hypothetical protein